MNRIGICWLYAITKYGYVISVKDLLNALDDAHRLGFSLFEIEGVAGDNLRGVIENKVAILKKCREAGVHIMNFIPVLPDLMSLDEARRKTALSEFRSGCETAAFFETDMIQIDTHYSPLYLVKPYDISQEFRFAYQPPKMRLDPSFDFWKYFHDVIVDSVSRCDDIARDSGLRLCIEPRTWENIPNVWALELLFREVGSNNVGAVFDTAHLACQKTLLVQAVEMLGEKIFYVHASDSDFKTEDHIEIGTGLIEWVSLLKALRKQRFDGVLGLDMGGASNMRDSIDETYVRSQKYLEDAMEKAKID